MYSPLIKTKIIANRSSYLTDKSPSNSGFSNSMLALCTDLFARKQGGQRSPETHHNRPEIVPKIEVLAHRICVGKIIRIVEFCESAPLVSTIDVSMVNSEYEPRNLFPKALS
jgi:hypothetical protein